MEHRISVGALVVKDDKILMVNHKRTNRYDFWVAPGGGVQGTESLSEAVIREVKEETGLKVLVNRLLYIEEMYNPEMRAVKFWYQCDYLGGELDCTAQEAVSEYIVNTKFLERSELENCTFFPAVLEGDFWQKLGKADVQPQHLALREMEFY